MAETPWDPKDPDEIKDYSYDWTAILNGDTISTSTWSVASGTGLIINSPASSFSGAITKFWASSGTLGQTYSMLNRITTAGGRTYDRTRKLKMKSL
jgi:hypothetical protein